MRKILQSFGLCLILSSCVSIPAIKEPVATTFDGNWLKCLQPPGEPEAFGLIDSDVVKLREILIKCETGKK